MTKKGDSDVQLDDASMRLLRQILPKSLPKGIQLTSQMMQEGLRGFEKRAGWANARGMMWNAICSSYHYNWLDEELFKFIGSKGSDIAAPFFLEIAQSQDKNHVAAQMALQKFARCGQKEKVLETLVKTILAEPKDPFFQIIAARCLSSFKEDAAADAVGHTLLTGEGISALDNMGKAEQSLSVEYACAQSLIAMKTEKAVSWLCVAHIKSSECAMVKKPILEMPEKAMPFLLGLIQHLKRRGSETAARLIVELGHGQSSIDFFTGKIREDGSEPERHGITSALIALRKALGSSRQQNVRGSPGEISLDTLSLKRFPASNPQPAQKRVQGPPRQMRRMP